MKREDNIKIYHKREKVVIERIIKAENGKEKVKLEKRISAMKT